LPLAVLTAPFVALVAAVLAGLVAAGLVYLRRPPRVSPPLSAGAQGTGAATADEGRLILDTLQRSNVLIWWAHVTREGTSFRWNIRTPPQLRDNPVYRLASPIDDRTLWRDDHAPDHERTRLTAESALAGGKRGYEQQFRIIGTDGVHWLNEEVVIRPRDKTSGTWRGSSPTSPNTTRPRPSTAAFLKMRGSVSSRRSPTAGYWP